MYQRIASLAKDRGVTIAEVSRQTGVAETVFSNLKYRGGNLSIDNALKVAQFFGVTIEDLLSNDQDE